MPRTSNSPLDCTRQHAVGQVRRPLQVGCWGQWEEGCSVLLRGHQGLGQGGTRTWLPQGTHQATEGLGIHYFICTFVEWIVNYFEMNYESFNTCYDHVFFVCFLSSKSDKAGTRLTRTLLIRNSIEILWEICTDKRTDVWSQNFIIWKINSGLLAVGLGWTVK